MPERAYTVAEIDRMREAVEHRCIWGCSIGDARQNTMSRTYNEVELIKRVEERLRTYMLAGVEPEELERPTEPVNESDSAR